jgi:hypothetical protein
MVLPDTVAMEPKSPATIRKSSAVAAKPVRAKGAVSKSDKADSGKTVARNQATIQKAASPEKNSPKATKSVAGAPASNTREKQPRRAKLSPIFS